MNFHSLMTQRVRKKKSFATMYTSVSTTGNHMTLAGENLENFTCVCRVSINNMKLTTSIVENGWGIFGLHSTSHTSSDDSGESLCLYWKNVSDQNLNNTSHLDAAVVWKVCSSICTKSYNFFHFLCPDKSTQTSQT